MTLSVVDWCEANYVVTPWIAEFWNTISSLLISGAGFYGAWKWGRERQELRFIVSFLMVALIGLGSALFHGTLLRASQALDELPMIYWGLLAVWMLLTRARPANEGRGLGAFFACVAVVFTLTYALFPAWFGLFLGGYAICLIFVVVRTLQLSMAPNASQLGTRLCIFAAVAYTGGFFLLWIPEHVLLPCDHPLQSLHLHSWWHVTSLLGAVAWCRWAVLDRGFALRERGSNP